MTKSSPSMKILSIFVAFLENMNFTSLFSMYSDPTSKDFWPHNLKKTVPLSSWLIVMRDQFWSNETKKNLLLEIWVKLVYHGRLPWLYNLGHRQSPYIIESCSGFFLSIIIWYFGWFGPVGQWRVNYCFILFL